MITSELSPVAVKPTSPALAVSVISGAVAEIDESLDVICTALAAWMSTVAALDRETPASPDTVRLPPCPPETNVQAPTCAHASCELDAAAQSSAAVAVQTVPVQAHTLSATALQPSDVVSMAQLKACVASQLCTDTLASNVALPPAEVTLAE